MRSYTRQSFWDTYHRLPEQLRNRARVAYHLFASDPYHPSLAFKRVSRRVPVYSVRITRGYRALGALHQGDIIWFWIGSHQEYDRLLKGL